MEMRGFELRAIACNRLCAVFQECGSAPACRDLHAQPLSLMARTDDSTRQLKMFRKIGRRLVLPAIILPRGFIFRRPGRRVPLAPRRQLMEALPGLDEDRGFAANRFIAAESSGSSSTPASKPREQSARSSLGRQISACRDRGGSTGSRLLRVAFRKNAPKILCVRRPTLNAGCLYVHSGASRNYVRSAVLRRTAVQATLDDCSCQKEESPSQPMDER